MKTKMKLFARTLSIVLTISLVVGAVPLHGFAVDAKPPQKVYREKDFSPVTGDLPVEAGLPDEPKPEQEEIQSLIVGEDTSLCTEDTKYFRCEDGRYVYQQERGKRKPGSGLSFWILPCRKFITRHGAQLHKVPSADYS